MIMEEEQEINRSLRRKKSSVVGNITCCFNGATHTHHRRRASLDGSVPFSSPSPVSASHHRKPTTSAWFKSKTNDLPEIKGRCRNFISRMGRHRRHSSADFSYDPLSYSLNFDDDPPSSSDDAIMDFNARLPVTPPRRTAPKTNPMPFQDHHLPRSPIREAYNMTGSGESDSAGPKKAGAGNDLRRGFEALSVTMKGSKAGPVKGQRRNNNNATTDQEEVTPPATPLSSSSNHGVLLQLC